MRTVVRALLWGMLVISFVGSVSVFAGRLKSARPVVSGAFPLAVEAFAEAFTREYLSWDSLESAEARLTRLGPFLSSTLRNQEGFRVEMVAAGRQNVVESRAWELHFVKEGFYRVEVLATLSDGRHIVLSVPVAAEEGRLFVYGLPAVKPFQTGGDGKMHWGPSAGDLPGLKPMLEGFFRAYLEGRDKSELANYVTDRAAVSPQGGVVGYRGISKLQAYTRKEGGYVVEATVEAVFSGVKLNEEFVLNVVTAGGKFYVDSILP